MGKGFEGAGADIDQRVVERLECWSGKDATTPGVSLRGESVRELGATEFGSRFGLADSLYISHQEPKGADTPSPSL